jgi:hypothetical protein
MCSCSHQEEACSSVDFDTAHAACTWFNGNRVPVHSPQRNLGVNALIVPTAATNAAAASEHALDLPDVHFTIAARHNQRPRRPVHGGSDRGDPDEARVELTEHCQGGWVDELDGG